MTVLQWIAPPVLGSFIGFLTNDIAIRMLFRPLKEYRVLGVRVPFTPGIIPRRRHELAEAIGRMVSEELVTAQTLGEYLGQPRAREGLRESVGRATSQVLDLPVAGLAHEAGQALAGPTLAKELLEGFLESDRFEAVVRTALRTALSALEETSIAGIAGGSDASLHIGRALVRLLPLDGARSSPDPDAVDASVRAARLLAGPAGRGLAHWLSNSPLRPEVERRAKELLRSALLKLTPVQRIVVRAAQYDRRLEEKLPEILHETVAKLGDYLSEESTQTAIGDAVRDALENRHGAPPDAPPASTADTSDRDASSIREALVDLAAAWVRPMLRKPLSAGMHDLAGVAPDRLVEELASRIVARARVPGTADKLLARMGKAARGAPSGDLTTLGELMGIRAATKQRLDALLADKALDLLRTRLADLLAGLDLRTMVVGRIDGLDVAQVERLLMMVIARHLKWINVFGAILGFLIGLSQAVMNAVL